MKKTIRMEIIVRLKILIIKLFEVNGKNLCEHKSNLGTIFSILCMKILYFFKFLL